MVAERPVYNCVKDHGCQKRGALQLATLTVNYVFSQFVLIGSSGHNKHHQEPIETLLTGSYDLVCTQPNHLQSYDYKKTEELCV